MLRKLNKTTPYATAVTPRVQSVIKAQRPPRFKTHDIPVDEAGNTALHQLVSSTIHANKLYRFTESNGSEKTKIMATMANNAGQLPVDLLTKQNDIVRNALINLAMPANYLGLNKPICIDDLIPPYFDYSDSKLLTALEVGCHIANKARETINQSNTHPDSGIHLKDHHDISIKLSQIRDQVIIRSHFTLNDMQKLSELIEQFRVGNCSEFSAYALNQLRHEPTNYIIHGEIARIKNEDHVFIVLNRIENSDPRNYKTWGVNAVIVDAWYGQVYPVAEIEVKLSGHRYYNEENSAFSFNILPKFNDKLHQIEIVSERAYSQRKSTQTFFRHQRARQDEPTSSLKKLAHHP